ncbi:MAG: sugar ABC transporter ATP-binding protein, partial [Rudaea sp.]
MSDPVESRPGGERVEPPLLSMRGIRKSFAAGEVLHGVDLTLLHGQIHALVGHNGAGKSTLMKVLGGVYNDYAGEILIEGAPVHPTSPHDAFSHRIAVIYQDFALVPDLTVAENIALGREPSGPWRGTIDHAEIRHRSSREAAAFGIPLPLDTKVRKLGVADQQLTEIAKALARDARILVMDEPTARLSPTERERLFDTMRRLKASGVGVIYISHFLEEVFAIADLVTILRDGKVVAVRHPSELDLPGLTALMLGGTAREEQAVRAERAREKPHPEKAPVLELKDFAPEGGSPVSLYLHAGEILGVAGLVGSGRTQLALGIVGVIPSKGEIRVNGAPVRFRTPAESTRAGVLLLPEDRKRQGLVLVDSVGENLSLAALGPRLSRLGIVRSRQQRDLIRDLMTRFHVLPPDPARPVRT